MGIGIGVLATRHIWVGVVDDTTLGAVRMYPEPSESPVELKSLHAGDMLASICRMIVEISQGQTVECVGAGFPGIVRNGVIEESPNLGQFKGLPVTRQLEAGLKSEGIDAPVIALNDADALAAGIAATRGRLENSSASGIWAMASASAAIHYGDGVWEAGHSVVSLDPKERYCGCGGVGHLEGIMGNRAIRLRFLDKEPEEVFAVAREGDQKAREFVTRWHRALAAATATNVHLDGPGRIYLAGPNADYIDTALLGMFLQEMVKMSCLQGSFFEVVPTSHDLALIGACVSAKAKAKSAARVH